MAANDTATFLMFCLPMTDTIPIPMPLFQQNDAIDKNPTFLAEVVQYPGAVTRT